MIPMVSKNRLAGSVVVAIAAFTGAALYFSQARTAVPVDKSAGLLAVNVAQSGGYLPDANRKYPERVLWGDEHVHTGWSVDAGLSGATLTPEDAVRFALGEQVTSSSGQPVRLSRPLDWIAVTDHSDAMGTIAVIREGNPEMMQDATLKRWHDMMAASLEEGSKATMEVVNAQANKKMPAALTDPKWAKTYWDKNIDIMEKYNEPGRFTAFISYEW